MPLSSLTSLFNFFYQTKQKTASVVRSLLGYSYVRLYLAGIASLLIVNWLSAYYIYISSSESPIIALHYNIDFGVNFIGNARQIYAMPALGTIIGAANLVLLLFFYNKNRFLSHLFSAASLFVNIILFISTFLIYLVNFR